MTSVRASANKVIRRRHARSGRNRPGYRLSLQPPHRQTFLAIQPVNAFHVHLQATPLRQYDPRPPIAEPRVLPRFLQECFAQFARSGPDAHRIGNCPGRSPGACKPGVR